MLIATASVFSASAPSCAEAVLGAVVFAAEAGELSAWVCWARAWSDNANPSVQRMRSFPGFTRERVRLGTSAGESSPTAASWAMNAVHPRGPEKHVARRCTCCGGSSSLVGRPPGRGVAARAGRSWLVTGTHLDQTAHVATQRLQWLAAVGQQEASRQMGQFCSISAATLPLRVSIAPPHFGQECFSPTFTHSVTALLAGPR